MSEIKAEGPTGPGLNDQQDRLPAAKPGQGEDQPNPPPGGQGPRLVQGAAQPRAERQAPAGGGGPQRQNQGQGQGKPQGQNRPGQNKPGQNKPQGQNKNRPQGQNNPQAQKPQGQKPQGQNANKGGPGAGGPRLVVAGGGAVARAEPAAPIEPAEPPLPALSEPALSYAQMQRRRKRRFLLQLAVFVALPTLLTLLYALFWASPRYISTAEVTYETYRPQQSLAAGLVQSVTGTSQSSSIDIATIIYEYIRSPALLDQLDNRLGLRKYYANSEKIDYLSRLNQTASRERFLSYYRSRVSVTQGLGGYLTIDVTAFDPDFALKLAAAVVEACDKMVDRITQTAREDEVSSALHEVQHEEERVTRARMALMEFQNAHGDVDPQRAATDLGQIVGHLESDLAAARTELTSSLLYMRPDAPKIAEIKFKITALEDQIRNERERLATKSGTNPYSKVLEQYTKLTLEMEFAKNALQAAKQGFAVASVDAGRKENYLVPFAEPLKPDRATHTFAVYSTLTAFFGSLVVFCIGSLIIRAFRDRAGL